MEPIFTDYEVNDAGENVLPTYCGYTVDIAGRAFYRVENDDFDYICSFAKLNRTRSCSTIVQAICTN